jgi:hypothetical protein
VKDEGPRHSELLVALVKEGPTLLDQEMKSAEESLAR